MTTADTETMVFEGLVDGAPTALRMTRSASGAVTLHVQMDCTAKRSFPEPDPGGYSVELRGEQAYSFTVDADEQRVFCETFPSAKQFWLLRRTD